MWRNGEIAAIASMTATSSGAPARAKRLRRTARRPRATRWMPPGASSRASGRDSAGIVEDHANRPPLARVELADAVAQLHLIVAAYALHRAAVDREDRRVTLLQRQNHGTGLHARTLLGHHKLTPHE